MAQCPNKARGLIGRKAALVISLVITVYARVHANHRHHAPHEEPHQHAEAPHAPAHARRRAQNRMHHDHQWHRRNAKSHPNPPRTPPRIAAGTVSMQTSLMASMRRESSSVTEMRPNSSASTRIFSRSPCENAKLSSSTRKSTATVLRQIASALPPRYTTSVTTEPKMYGRKPTTGRLRRPTRSASREALAPLEWRRRRTHIIASRTSSNTRATTIEARSSAVQSLPRIAFLDHS